MTALEARVAALEGNNQGGSNGSGDDTGSSHVPISEDNDSDGFTIAGDCNDANGDINPEKPKQPTA